MWTDKFISKLYREACLMKLEEGTQKEPSYSEHEKFKPSPPPEDWAKRDNQGRWTPPAVGRTSFRVKRREARKKEALFGPPMTRGIVGHHHVPGWQYDSYQNGYTSHTGSVFVCGCGEQLPVPSYRTCKCGRIWNSYSIGSGPASKEASTEMYLCREIPVRPGVIMANNRRSGK